MYYRQQTVYHIMFNEAYDKLVKISVVGDTCVGKTALIRRLINDEFSDIYNATICMDFNSPTIEDGTGKLIKIQAWDTSGQEIFRSMTTSYLRTGDVTLVCFAYNDRDSFVSIDMWIKQLHDSNVKTKMILVGTKGDLPGTVKDKEALECAAHYNMEYIRTSSLSGLGRLELLNNIYVCATEPTEKTTSVTNDIDNLSGSRRCCAIL